MALYKPTELRQFLDQLGIHPKKSLSQNFLIDGNIIRRIIATAEVAPGDIVIEIGPGPGALTEALLAAGAKVLAIEKDDTYASTLSRLDPSNKRLHVVHGDALEVDIERPLQMLGAGDKKVKLIANLPYHLTTPLLARFVTMNGSISTLYVMVQEEVGRRMTAKVDTSEYSSFTLFLEFYSYPRYCFAVTRKCFFPAPKVDSAIIALPLHTPALDGDVEGFFKITRTAFEQRRKMLRGSLKGLYPPERTMEALVAIGVDPRARPEQLSLAQFLAFHRKVCQG